MNKSNPDLGEQSEVEVFGARVHNLKNIDVSFPRNKLVVITGLSGSGKSSLAFDTIYAEGQRRYMETFSAYSRQFLGGMERPDVDKISGLSPVIAIEQKTTSKNPRSTVGTITEIYDFMRLLFARTGEAFSYFRQSAHPDGGAGGQGGTKQFVAQVWVPEELVDVGGEGAGAHHILQACACAGQSPFEVSGDLPDLLAHVAFANDRAVHITGQQS